MPLHQPMDRAATAMRIYSSCLSGNAIRLGSTTRVAAPAVVRAARASCRAERRDLDEVFRSSQLAAGARVRGIDHTVLTGLEAEAASALSVWRLRPVEAAQLRR
jgi:hypothetical protein